jgi:SAM-dependent methyltransferase
VSPISELVTTLGPRVPLVVEAFRHGGGIPYDDYRPDFTRAMDAIGRGTFDELLIDELLPLADGLVDRLDAGIRVADFGCGTGHAINLMAKAHPASTFVGYDLADDAIATARTEAACVGLGNAEFEVRDVLSVPREPGFDAVFAFDAVHDQADPTGVLDRVMDVLRPGGWFVMVDTNANTDLADNLDHPLGPFLYAVSTLHCMQVSLAEGGVGLGTVWGRQLAERMLAEAGFVDVEVHEAPGDPLNLVYVSHKPR